MNLAAYRYDKTTVSWSMEVKPKRVIEQIPVYDAIHSLMGRAMLMGGRGKYFDQKVVAALSDADWMTINREAPAVDAYLNGRSSAIFTDADVVRVFSKVYHLWNPDDPTGAESRHAITQALVILGLGKELSAAETFPQLKNTAEQERPSHSRA